MGLYDSKTSEADLSAIIVKKILSTFIISKLNFSGDTLIKGQKTELLFLVHLICIWKFNTVMVPLIVYVNILRLKKKWIGILKLGRADCSLAQPWHLKKIKMRAEAQLPKQKFSNFLGIVWNTGIFLCSYTFAMKMNWPIKLLYNSYKIYAFHSWLPRPCFSVSRATGVTRNGASDARLIPARTQGCFLKFPASGSQFFSLSRACFNRLQPAVVPRCVTNSQ